jgi:hypothetical protein
MTTTDLMPSPTAADGKSHSESADNYGHVIALFVRIARSMNFGDGACRS